jgi:hypothetical protein
VGPYNDGQGSAAGSAKGRTSVGARDRAVCGRASLEAFLRRQRPGVRFAITDRDQSGCHARNQ